MNHLSKTPIYVHGYGSVSSAGQSSAELFQKCSLNLAVETQNLERTLGGKTISYTVRPVDKVELRKNVPKHPRLRRSSSITKFAIAAAKQALSEERMVQIKDGEFRLGIVMSCFNGCINYTNRFYAEVLDDPAFASPILFPETVFNAPASHVSSYFESPGPVYTLLGDSSVWFSAMEVARGWLASDQVDGCLVLCGEELGWLSAEALRYHSDKLIATEGASAIYLEREKSEVLLERISEPRGYTTARERRQAIREVFDEIQNEPDSLLVDGLVGVETIDRDELRSLESWQGARMSPLATLGLGMGASCGFQTIAALEALRSGYNSSIVMASGSNQQACSAHFRQIK